MKRRAFLQSAASVVPLALAHPFAHALQQSPAPPAATDLHLLHTGEDRFGENHSLGFSKISFKTSTAETAGNLFIIEHTGLSSGGPPLHLHTDQEEWFCVVAGEVLFQVGDRRVTLKPGDSILGPRNVPHTFRAVGETPAHMIIAFSPAGRMEQFFRDTAVPNSPPEDDAFLRRYGMELIGPPLTAG
jgi:mannose-6-phosphate isomerase-like protein (cupin superfamily)